MDPQLADIQNSIGNINERTKAILANQESLKQALETHEERDRQDFKAINIRMTQFERVQNWILGVGSAVIAVAGIAITYVKSLGG